MNDKMAESSRARDIYSKYGLLIRGVCFRWYDDDETKEYWLSVKLPHELSSESYKGLFKDLQAIVSDRLQPVDVLATGEGNKVRIYFTIRDVAGEQPKTTILGNVYGDILSAINDALPQQTQADKNTGR